MSTPIQSTNVSQNLPQASVYTSTSSSSLAFCESIIGYTGIIGYHCGGNLLFEARNIAHEGLVFAARIIYFSAVRTYTLIGTAFGILTCLAFRVYQMVLSAGIWVHNQIGTMLGILTDGVFQMGDVLKSALGSGFVKTRIFVKENWHKLIAYTIAWGVVITCSGALYGFQAVALPLTIGFGCGLVIGGMLGILVGTVLDPENKHPGKNTGWNVINGGIKKLDPNGTRQIMLSISVTVLLAASVIFPYAMGGIFGFLVGWQVLTKIAQRRPLGANPHNFREQIEMIRQQLSAAWSQLIELNERLVHLEQQQHNPGNNPQSFRQQLESLRQESAAIATQQSGLIQLQTQLTDRQTQLNQRIEQLSNQIGENHA